MANASASIAPTAVANESMNRRFVSWTTLAGRCSNRSRSAYRANRSASISASGRDWLGMPQSGYDGNDESPPGGRAGFCDSGIRESNPSHSLGKAGHNRYTNPANITNHSDRPDVLQRSGRGNPGDDNRRGPLAFGKT